MNKNISNLHLDILDSKRQELLKKLSIFTESFTLGGGTALALYLKHRKSFDFDFFSLKPVDKNLLEKISKTVLIGNIVNNTPDELTFFTKNGIKTTFLYYPFKPYFKPFLAGDNLRLFDIKDIAVQKAYTIGRRGEYRDYFDLYTILKLGFYDLTKIIETAKKVYGSVFEEKIFLQQLVYFDDLLNFDIIPDSTEKLPTKEEVKRFLEKLVSDYTE
jgi:predicted nucleotidyltransferase component of viral defense system